MPYSYEAPREDMLVEPSEKLLCVKRHYLGFIIPVVSPGERDAGLIDIQDPVISNGYFMCVPAQVFNNLFGSGKRLFSIYNPVCFVEFSNQWIMLGHYFL